VFILLQDLSTFFFANIFRHSLKEILADKTVQEKISHSSALSEYKILDKFYEMLREEPDKVLELII
jgi:stalled ribosome rescue protein Dom34